jgi:hypothetical protein
MPKLSWDGAWTFRQGPRVTGRSDDSSGMALADGEQASRAEGIGGPDRAEREHLLVAESSP